MSKHPSDPARILTPDGSRAIGSATKSTENVLTSKENLLIGEAQVASQSPAPPDPPHVRDDYREVWLSGWRAGKADAPPLPIGTTNHVVGPFDTRGLITPSPPRAQDA